MGFHTEFQITYPGDPGNVTGAAVRNVLEKLAPQCGSERWSRSVCVKLGMGPAKSDRPFFVERAHSQRFSTFESDWDYETEPTSHAELMDDLLSLGERSIHRALVECGRLSPKEVAELTREPGPENDVGLYPVDLGLAIGPIEVESDDDNFRLVQIGWTSITISGNGYCYPWTHQELIERCLATEFCAQARAALLAEFGAPDIRSLQNVLMHCTRRVRMLPDSLVAAVRGI